MCIFQNAKLVSSAEPDGTRLYPRVWAGFGHKFRRYCMFGSDSWSTQMSASFNDKGKNTVQTELCWAQVGLGHYIRTISLSGPGQVWSLHCFQPYQVDPLKYTMHYLPSTKWLKKLLIKSWTVKTLANLLAKSFVTSPLLLSHFLWEKHRLKLHIQKSHIRNTWNYYNFGWTCLCRTPLPIVQLWLEIICLWGLLKLHLSISSQWRTEKKSVKS